jgi:succinate dehydrogenase / fumarate reductase cytochrome b subunit
MSLQSSPRSGRNSATSTPSRTCPPTACRQPGWVSILHRVSGVLMFVLLPFIIWMFDTSVSSEFPSHASRFRLQRRQRLRAGLVLKLVALALIWAYLHHFIAGLRHLWMDVSHKAVSKEFGTPPPWSRWSPA